MNPQDANQLFENLHERIQEAYADDRVHCGVFGAMMDVALVR